MNESCHIWMSHVTHDRIMSHTCNVTQLRPLTWHHTRTTQMCDPLHSHVQHDPWNAPSIVLIDVAVITSYYFVRNSLVALLEALCARYMYPFTCVTRPIHMCTVIQAWSWRDNTLALLYACHMWMSHVTYVRRDSSLTLMWPDTRNIVCLSHVSESCHICATGLECDPEVTRHLHYCVLDTNEWVTSHVCDVTQVWPWRNNTLATVVIFRFACVRESVWQCACMCISVCMCVCLCVCVRVRESLSWIRMTRTARQDARRSGKEDAGHSLLF